MSRPARLALSAIAGALLAAGYALHPQWWAPWLAPLPLVVAGSGSRGHARRAGAVAGAAAMIGVLGYYVEMSGWAVTLVISLLRVGAWVFASRLAHDAARRLPLGLAMLVLPATIAALETLTLAVSPHGAAGSLAYSQMDVPAVVQVAALGGVPAVVFLVLLPGSLAGLWGSGAWSPPQRRTAGAALVLIGTAVVLFSAGRLHAPTGSREIPVALVATDQFDGIPGEWEPVWAAYRPAVAGAARQGGLVVLPEKVALLDAAAAARAALDVATAARAAGTTVVVGVEVRDGGTYRNRALVAGPDGRIAWYDKQRLVPGWEDRDVPGRTPLFVAAAGTHVGVAICKDMHVPGIGREYAGSAAIVTVPAWDFGRDGWMGARMTAMRAVENGYAVARSAREGFLGAYDRTGRTRAERPVVGGTTIATTTLPAHGAETLYGRVGDVFGWICVLAVGFLAVWRRVRWSRDGRRAAIVGSP
ncbi:MAG: hypothetical protein JO040_11060 [Gemmatimonadetes bacterium]|nr:hypothetical protein [Gemmatimonadota bacterium]